MRRSIAVLAGLAILALANWTVWQREQLLAGGKVAVLELAPVDPRSLMQGDYMALRFQLADHAFGRGRVTDTTVAADGRLVARADEKGVARFVRRDAGEPLAEGEFLLRYRVRNGEPKFATNAFFFQEGHAKFYERARFGEFRVAPSGDMLLTHMLGENRQRLGAIQGGKS
jgi:uncharacterized membrane-anchored protein